MHNFFSDQRMKNLMELEEENDLTKLTLGIGSPNRVTHLYPYPSPSLSLTLSLSGSSSPPPSPSPSTLTPLQTDILLMQIQQSAYSLLGPFSSNPNPNTNLMVSSSFNHNTNPQNAADVNANVPTEDVNTPTPTASPTPTPTPTTTRTLRRTRARSPNNEKGETVPVPFPWATDRRATVHSHRYLVQNNIHTITGRVQCKKCLQEFQMSVDVEEKMTELRKIIQKRGDMHDRAPKYWSTPVFPKCILCGREDSARPVIAKKRGINWLFLLLTQTIGCCTLQQLKFFCKHTDTHRTGAKDRLIYLTYMVLWKQLFPDWPM